MLTRPDALKRIDALLGPALCRVFARTQRALRYPALESLGGALLVVRPGGIGDAVMTLPMLSSLRAALPGREVDVLCESRNRALYRLADPALRLLSYDTDPFGTLLALRRRGYALVLDTEQYHHFSAVLAAWTRAPLRVGFKINARRNALYTHLVGYDLDGPEDRQFGRLAAAVLDPLPPLPEKHGLLAAAALPPLAPHGGGAAAAPLAAVHAGGSVPEKRWAAEKYAALCDQLAERFGLAPVLLGGAADRTFARTIRRLCRRPPEDACGTCDLSGTAALCRAASVFVGPDSGIAHLASAVGTPCVVLFGPSDPAKWGPGEQGRVVRHPVPCGPCAIFGYNKPCRIHACMEGIAVESVLEAVASLPDLFRCVT